MALKQQERAEVRRILQGENILTEQLLELPAASDLAVFTEESILRVLRLRPVATPVTGHCLALALVQALANDDLGQMKTLLHRAAACVKRGIKYAGQLHLTDQFDHADQLKTLVSVRRGWMAMSLRESTKQFKWYLEEYAASATERVGPVDHHNWGGSAMLLTAANFLQRDVYVIWQPNESHHPWHCCVYRPSSMTKANKVVETGEQLS